MNRRQRARKKQRAKAHQNGHSRPLTTGELLELSKPVLKQLAAERGMTVKSKTTKVEMVEYLSGVAA